MRRRIRYTWLKTLKLIRESMSEGMSPHRLSMAFVVTLFWGTMPMLGLVTALSLFSSWLFRLSVPLVVGLTFVITPLQAILVLPFIQLGKSWFPFTLGEDGDNIWPDRLAGAVRYLANSGPGCLGFGDDPGLCTGLWSVAPFLSGVVAVEESDAVHPFLTYRSHSTTTFTDVAIPLNRSRASSLCFPLSGARSIGSGFFVPNRKITWP